MAKGKSRDVWKRIHETLSAMDQRERAQGDEAQNALREIWRRRAESLARPTQTVDSNRRWEKLVILRIGMERYAFRVDDVEEIMRLMPITPIPCVPPHFLGVVNRRGSILPIVDLQVLFGGSRSLEAKESRIVVLARKKHTLGLMVEAADQIVSFPAESILPPLQRADGPQAEFAAGVITLGTRMVVLIDSGKLLQDEKMKVDQAP